MAKTTQAVTTAVCDRCKREGDTGDATGRQQWGEMHIGYKGHSGGRTVQGDAGGINHNEAMNQLPHNLATLIKCLPQAPFRDHLAAECIKQAERIAELEAEVQEQARCNGMGAERELALMAERDQHQATALALLSLLADIRKACGDNGKRMQPALVEFIGGLAGAHVRFGRALTARKDKCKQLTSERDTLRVEVERTSNNRDMWRGQCERQAEQLAQMREEVERLREFFDADRLVNKIMDEVSPGLTSPKGADYAARVDAAINRRCAAVAAIDTARKATP